MPLALPQFVIDSPICVECQGACCKNMPGICWPENIKPLTADRIVQMVRHERYAIDWYEGDPRPGRLVGGLLEIVELDRVFYVRPAMVGITKALDPSFGGNVHFSLLRVVRLLQRIVLGSVWQWFLRRAINAKPLRVMEAKNLRRWYGFHIRM